MAKLTNRKRQKEQRRECATEYYKIKYSEYKRNEHDDYWIVRDSNRLPRWEDLTRLDEIECGGIKFEVDDEIEVKVKDQREPARCQIRSMRQHQTLDGTLEFLNVLWIYTKSEAKKFILSKEEQKILRQNAAVVTNHADIIFITEVIKKSTKSKDTLPDRVLHIKRRQMLPREDERVAWLFRNDGAPTNKIPENQFEPATPADTATQNQIEISSSDPESSEDSEMMTNLDSIDNETQRVASPLLGDANRDRDDDDIDTESSQPEAPTPTVNPRKRRRDDGEEAASMGDSSTDQSRTSKRRLTSPDAITPNSQILENATDVNTPERAQLKSQLQRNPEFQKVYNYRHSLQRKLLSKTTPDEQALSLADTVMINLEKIQTWDVEIIKATNVDKLLRSIGRKTELSDYGKYDFCKRAQRLAQRLDTIESYHSTFTILAVEDAEQELTEVIESAYDTIPSDGEDEEPMGKLLCQFAATNYTSILHGRFEALIVRGGDFGLDIARKLSRRLLAHGASGEIAEDECDHRIETLEQQLRERDMEIKSLNASLHDSFAWGRGITKKGRRR